MVSSIFNLSNSSKKATSPVPECAAIKRIPVSSSGEVDSFNIVTFSSILFFLLVISYSGFSRCILEIVILPIGSSFSKTFCRGIPFSFNFSMAIVMVSFFSILLQNI